MDHHTALLLGGVTSFPSTKEIRSEAHFGRDRDLAVHEQLSQDDEFNKGGDISLIPLMSP